MPDIQALLEAPAFEEGIRWIVGHVTAEEGHINGMMAPRFYACDKEKPSITLEYDIADWETNSNHFLHGGICATMMDTTIGIFANYLSHGLGNGFAPTVSMSIQYLRPVPAGSVLQLEAKLNSFGKSLIHLYAEARIKGRPEICATATAAFSVQPQTARAE